MTEQDLAINLQVVVDDAAETPVWDATKGALGVLSTDNSKTWLQLQGVI